MSTLTPEEIRRALRENRGLPHGAARNAQAEALTAAAEVCGDTEVFRIALINQIDSYEYSAERSRMVVPFARLLQEYDRDPSAFTPDDAHSLFWRFKWVSGQIISSPDVPVSSVTGYLDDMEKRYRIAGYSERAVRQSEYFLADAIGDDERAERAMAQWRAADRDEMSDCHACETNSQGVFWATKGEHARAIEVWGPVLNGEQTCMEEPHRVLARSLLPLLRLGRTDEARSHHLRGYRMARGKESLLRAIGQHIEFCALTGNEARGVEILAEHGAHLRPLVDVRTQMDFYAGVVVLLRRLVDLGHAADPAVPYGGSARTVGELHGILREEALGIAGRFDVRNGTTRVSERLLERLSQAPLADVLPLGVRSAALPQPTAATAAPAAAAVPVSAAEFAGLVERARDARDAGHPDADGLWAEVAVRISALPEAEVDPLLRAEVADHRALTAARAGAPDAAELLTAVRDGYRALGQAERAALAELRLASAAAQAGAAPEEVRAQLAAGLRAAEALDAAEPLRARRIAVAELSALRLEPYLRSAEAAREHAEEHVDGHDHGHDHGHGHGHGDGHGDGHTDGHGHGEGHDHGHGHELPTAELASFVSSYGQALPDLAAEAEEMLGRLSLSQGDNDRALELLASAADRAVGAGRPWQAVDPLVLRAGVLLSLGRPEEAEAAARSGLEHSAEETDPEQQGLVHLTLADVLLRGRDTVAEAAEHALAAAHWFDQAGLAADGGAQARRMLAQAYARDGRTADAAEVLQSALPDLLEHGEGQAVSARDFLGNLLRDLREPRAAAEQFLQAAELVKDWEDPRPQARFAQAAADCLSDTGLDEEAVAAYRRALELRRLTGDAVVSEVRILRSLAWLGMREEVTEETAAAARALMDEAAEVLEKALAADGSGDSELLSELAQTWHQLAQVLDRLVSALQPEGAGEPPAGNALSPAAVEALRLEEIRLWERAAELYAKLGLDNLQDRFQCLNNAAWTHHELGRPAVGAALISALLEEVETLPEGMAPEWVAPQARRIITQLTA
ncbi:tetratricopeptide repeat protein [Streptomyces sp. NPDC012794]|uniref:tetratricopeptide repeat protein n=1 Tax=Streptomyces sp. NPDC012794 TaxID=3364850 RepID=UPI0036BC588D